MVVLILVLTFVILFVLGIPIAFCLGVSTLATMLFTMDLMPAVTTIAQRMAGGIVEGNSLRCGSHVILHLVLQTGRIVGNLEQNIALGKDADQMAIGVNYESRGGALGTHSRQDFIHRNVAEDADGATHIQV